MVAHGFRNPFTFAVRPGSDEVWIADVGWNQTEEIDVIPSATDATVENFGWPCYEGSSRQPDWDALNLNLCEGLYSAPGAHTQPRFSYDHDEVIVAGESCTTGGSVAGLAFYEGGNYPARYDDALFFGDYVRGCIWAMLPGAGGDPDPGNIETFVESASTPVRLQIGPGGDLFYVDIFGGTIRRIRYFDANQPPEAVAAATPTNGRLPLEVTFDASGSSDADNDPLAYAWDLDGDGQHDDSTALQPTHTYTQAGAYDVTVKVTDEPGASDVSPPVRISAGNTPPEATIHTPAMGAPYDPGDVVSFSGSAADEQDGSLAASAFAWTVTLHHCPATCHRHPVETADGVKSGSFAVQDHEQPSHLEVGLTVTDSGGLTDHESVLMYPRADTTAPEVTAPAESLALGAIDRTSAPTTLTWSATDASGVASYELQRSVGGGAYAPVSLSSVRATVITQRLEFAKTYRYRVRATDLDGNVSAWSQGRLFKPRVFQENAGAVSYMGSWRRQAMTGASGGYVKHSGAAGTRATFSFAGGAVSWVAARAPDRGKAAVWIDGVEVAVIDLFASSRQTRKMVMRADLPPGAHTLQVRPLGQKRAAATGTRVDVDAFVILE